ncbi:MAG: tail fiber domain-containing protein [Acidobacteriota bacterium]
MNRSFAPMLVLIAGLLLATAAVAGSPATYDAELQIEASRSKIYFWSNDEHAGIQLRVASPCGEVFETVGDPGREVLFTVDRPDGELWPDGTFSWNAVLTPVLSSGQKEELRRLRLLGETPKKPPVGGVASGSFSIDRGEIIYEPNSTESDLDRGAEIVDKVGPASAADLLAEAGLPTKDQVIFDDLIVDGSACVGFDCVNGESFGFDTFRLKENNLRLHFEDTSSTASFPSRDWRLVANDSANGGLERFSIQDASANRFVFTVEGNAPTNALYVDDGGRVGLGTSTPVADVHVVDGDTPTVRLEQNGTSGFSPQTWDMAGNEANFFIRDATNGSALPFRIRPGSPGDSLTISDGNVGVGLISPTSTVHVRQSSGDAQILVQEQNAEEENRKLFLLENNGGIEFEMVNTAANGATWFFQNDSNANDPFNISKRGSGGVEFQINDRLDANGVATVIVDGSVQATNVVFMSARDRKTAFSMVDPADVLARVSEMPIQTWRYHEEQDEIRHMGPIAEDFAAAFGLGQSEKHITVTDANGVALAAIQGLLERIETLEAELEALRAERD